jgi:hypothetical protein
VGEAPCVHCGVSIITDGHDGWVHLTSGGHPGLGRCQHPDVEYGHLAHPASVPCGERGTANPCLGASR